MAEPRNTRGGAAGNGVITIGGKSINMIRSQMDRITGAFRRAYSQADRLSGAERTNEMDRLFRRYNATNNTARRYEENISRQPEYEAITDQLRATYRNGGNSPEESLETARRINELREKRNNLRYPRATYARNNRR